MEEKKPERGEPSKTLALGKNSKGSSSSTAPAHTLTLDDEDSDMAEELKLSCLLEGNTEPFKIAYISDEDAGALKMRIWPDQTAISRSQFILWRSEIPIPNTMVASDYYDQYIKVVTNDNSNWFGPNLKISDKLSPTEVDSRCIQVVIQKSPSNLTRNQGSSSRKRKAMQEIALMGESKRRSGHITFSGISVTGVNTFWSDFGSAVNDALRDYFEPGGSLQTDVTVPDI
ncbi:hypothetical protein BGX27_002747 [Mortierella sp. AM989]|nr:hypothetical protein BGX27_002747 [Mortierella sp. AM989]